MDILNIIIFPFLLGLLGFIEPCSMGTNLIFFQYMLFQNYRARFFHGLLFTLTRALFLGLIGISSAFIGRQVIGIQDNYIRFLGVIYLAFGLVILKKGLSLDIRLPLPHLPERFLPLLLGGAFGLAVPACASPLILALAGGAAMSGHLWFGFLSLFIFGLGLSFPLVIMVYSKKTREITTHIAGQYPQKLQYLVGGILVLAGIYTILAQSGSIRVILEH